jgi:hypothetical protein
MPTEMPSPNTREPQGHFQIETAGRRTDTNRDHQGTLGPKHWKGKTMFKIILIAATLTATGALASDTQDSRIAELCGAEHVNEATSPDDVSANPDGYYIASIGEQVSLGDPRIVLTNDAEPYFCTRSAALPTMDATNFALRQDQRVTRWLFVQPHPWGN